MYTMCQKKLVSSKIQKIEINKNMETKKKRDDDDDVLENKMKSLKILSSTRSVRRLNSDLLFEYWVSLTDTRYDFSKNADVSYTRHAHTTTDLSFKTF